MSAATTAELYRDYVMPTYGRFDLALARGEGSRVWDEEGKEYLDFGAGIAVCSLGHSHPKLSKAIADQAARLVHTSNLYLTRPQGELAKLVVDLLGLGGKVFFCNSGAEANEGLYKLARKFGAPTGRHEIITFTNSFHGRTLGGISATGQEKVKAGFAPLVEGFVHVPFNDLAAAEAAAPALRGLPSSSSSGPGRAELARFAGSDMLRAFIRSRPGAWCKSPARTG
jgi:acetylornithine/succinyldiaminopimelate/putrescine aminotransferase